MLVLARLCLTLFILGSLGLAATYVSHACPCPLLFNFNFSVFLSYLGQLGFAMSLVLLFHCWGLLWDLQVYPKAVFSCPFLHVNCLPVTEFGPFRRLIAAVTLCSAAFLFWLFIFQQPLFLRWVSAFFLWFCFSDASPMIYLAKTTVKAKL